MPGSYSERVATVVGSSINTPYYFIWCRVHASAECFFFYAGDQESILEVLLGCSESEEECRNVVAECLGHLAVIHPLDVFDVLTDKIVAESANMRYTVITSVKYTVLDRENSTDPVLHGALPQYLRLIEDEDRHVRKAAVQVLSSVLTHKVALVEEHLSSVLPMLYNQTIKRKDLIRILDLGPFKCAVRFQTLAFPSLAC